MASGRINGTVSGTSGSKYDLWVEWTSTPDSYNIRSYLTVKLYLQRNDGYANSFSDSSANPMGVEISDTDMGVITSYDTTSSIDTRNSVKDLLFQYSAYIPHEPDGTKQVVISAGFGTIDRPTVTGGAVSGTVTLDNITPSIPNPTTNKSSYAVGESIIINTNRVQNYTHTVKAEVLIHPSYTLYFDIATGVTTTTTWNTATVASDIYNALINRNSTSCIIKVSAYNGGTLVGTKTKSVTLNITDADPVFTTFTQEDINTTTLALTGDSQRFIKGYSNGKITITPAIPQKGASLTGYEVSWGSKTATLPYNSTGTTLTNVDGNKVSITVKDSRGNRTTVSHTVTLIDYFIPLFKAVTAKRTANIEAETTLTLSAEFFNQSFGSVNNTSTLEYRFKQTSSETWGSWINVPHTPSGNTITVDTTISGDITGGFDPQKSFDIEVRLRDEVTAASYSLVLPKGVPLMDFQQDGIGVGKVWEHGALDIAGDIYWNGLKIGDPVQYSFTVGSNTYYAYAAKIGKTIVLLMPEFTGLSGTGTTTLFTLATAYRPSVQRRFDYICFSSAGYGTMASAFLVVETTGKVKIMSNVSGIPSGNIFFAKSFNYFGG